MTHAEARVDAFTDSEFRIGKVLSKSLSVFFQNFVTFTLIAAVVALPVVLFGTMEPGAQPTSADFAKIFGGVAMMFFLSPLATAIILHAAFQHMRGRPVRLTESVSGGLWRFLPLLGVMFLFGLGVSLGLLLLIVPGLILMAIWYVAVPACVVEKTGPIQSLRRSRELTKGYRWKIFALVIIVYIVGIIGNNVVVLLATALAGTTGQIGAMIVWQGVAGGFGSVLIAVAYYYLRVAKEGVDVEQIASVFD
jgi:hypothetical protein